MMKPTWSIAASDPGNISAISNEYKVCRPIAMILANRKIPLPEIDLFLRPRLRDLSDPYNLPGILLAVERLWKAIELREKILVFGDYDTDGITSTALISWVLKRSGAVVETYLPHRLDDGYGLTEKTIKKSLDGHKVIVTVDCGINSVDAVKVAKDKGIDVIVTDHHQPGDEVPDAFVVINPKLNKDMEKLYVLAGVGVCFKLCHGFIKYGREHNFGGNLLLLASHSDLIHDHIEDSPFPNARYPALLNQRVGYWEIL